MARIMERQKKNLIGDRLREERQKRGMSQELLSAKLELLGVYICRGSISRMEDGLRTVTDLELVAIAAVLRLSVTDLLPVNIFREE